MAHDSSMYAGACWVAGINAASMPVGVAGGNVSRATIVTGDESSDSIALPVEFGLTVVRTTYAYVRPNSNLVSRNSDDAVVPASSQANLEISPGGFASSALSVARYTWYPDNVPA